MEHRPLGRTGLRVSALCMGCWEIGGLFWGPVDAESAVALVRQAYEAGVTTFDLADNYGNGRSEILAAVALGAMRDRVILVTKAGYIMGADGAQSVMPRPFAQRFDRAYLTWECEMSLWRLGTDYIDVYLLHDYLLYSADPAAEATDEPFEALRRLKEAGKIRYYGVSSSPPVARLAVERFGAEVVEVPFNLLNQQAAHGLFPAVRAHGAGVLARSPFANGRLFREEGRTFGTLVRPPARSLVELAIKFVLSEDVVASVVSGIMREAELRENVAAAAEPFQLALGQMVELREAAPPAR
jgi:aryl-alcohol dehydrogenase-like predicted oxidoreductase